MLKIEKKNKWNKKIENRKKMKKTKSTSCNSDTTAFPKGKASTMSQDDQVAVEEGSNMVSRAENVPKSA